MAATAAREGTTETNYFIRFSFSVMVGTFKCALDTGELRVANQRNFGNLFSRGVAFIPY